MEKRSKLHYMHHIILISPLLYRVGSAVESALISLYTEALGPAGRLTGGGALRASR